MRNIASGLNPSAPPCAGVLIACGVLAVVLLLNALHHPWTRMAAVPVALGLGWLTCSRLGCLKPSPVQDAAAYGAWIVVPIPFKYGLTFRWAFGLPFLFVYTITTREMIGDITATSQPSLQPI